MPDYRELRTAYAVERLLRTWGWDEARTLIRSQLSGTYSDPPASELTEVEADILPLVAKALGVRRSPRVKGD